MKDTGLGFTIKQAKKGGYMSLRKSAIVTLLSLGCANVGLLRADPSAGDSTLVVTAEQPAENGDAAKAPKEPGVEHKAAEMPVMWDFSALAKSVVGSVVSITAVQAKNQSDEMRSLGKKFQGTPFDDFFRFFPAPSDAPRKVPVGGSGFFIGVDKDVVYVATNYHIVEDAVSVKIFFDDKTEVPAVVHGSDPRTDLAVLKVNLSDIPVEKRNKVLPVRWGASSQSEVGQWVVAVGNPFGLGNTVTCGIISAKGRDLHIGGVSLNDDFLQHSAQINAGNSGGCLVNMKGEVIGINTVIVTPSGGNVGIGFAIPSDNALRVLEQLIKYKKVRHGALGVSVGDFTKEHMAGLNIKTYKGGAVVMRVEKEGPAAVAGIQEDDVIVKFDDTLVNDVHQLSRAVDNAQVDSEHKVTVIRKGKEMVIKVKVGDFAKINGISTDDSKENGRPAEILGLTLSDFPANKENLKGALVRKVTPDSPADNAGLRPQDCIVAVNQTEIRSAQEFREIVLKAAKTQDYILLKVNRGGVSAFMAVKISEDPDLKKAAEKKPTKPSKEENEKARTQTEPEGSKNHNISEPTSASPKSETTSMAMLNQEPSAPSTGPVSSQETDSSSVPTPAKKLGLWTRFLNSLKSFFGVKN